MPRTSSPAATRRGSSCFPIAPVAPATNTLIISSLIEDCLHPTRRGGTPGCDTCDHPPDLEGPRIVVAALMALADALVTAQGAPGKRLRSQLPIWKPKAPRLQGFRSSGGAIRTRDLRVMRSRAGGCAGSDSAF